MAIGVAAGTCGKGAQFSTAGRRVQGGRGVHGARGLGPAERRWMAPASLAAAFCPSWPRGGRAMHGQWVNKEKAVGAGTLYFALFSSLANGKAALWGHWQFVLV